MEERVEVSKSIDKSLPDIVKGLHVVPGLFAHLLAAACFDHVLKGKGFNESKVLIGITPLLFYLADELFYTV